MSTLVRKEKSTVSDQEEKKQVKPYPVVSQDLVLTSYFRKQLALCTKTMFDKLYPKAESEDPKE